MSMSEDKETKKAILLEKSEVIYDLRNVSGANPRILNMLLILLRRMSILCLSKIGLLIGIKRRDQSLKTLSKGGVKSRCTFHPMQNKDAHFASKDNSPAV